MNEPDNISKPELIFQTYELPAGRGRQITVWRTVNIDRRLREAPILLAPGFGRRMSSFAPLAQYLALNGFEVFRYDPLDHVGSSSGDMIDFTMSTGLSSMKTVAEWMLAERGFDDIGIVATSLSARMAYRLVSSMPRIRFLITAVGVTHLRDTLATVFGEDYSRWAEEELPPSVPFEKHHRIGSARFCRDAVAGDWWTLDGTVEELRGCQVPMATFVGSEDTWVREGDVRAALETGPGAGRRKLLTFAGSGHDLGRNPAIARRFFRELTRAAVMLCEGLPDLGDIEFEPSFTELTEVAINEKRLQQRAYAPVEGSPS